MEDATKIWLDDADYDIKSAAAMLKAGRYFYVVFMCHLAIESSLKAVWAASTEATPPMASGLAKLTTQVFKEKTVPDTMATLIDEIDDKRDSVLYPEGRLALERVVNMEYSEAIFRDTVGAINWCRSRV